MFYFQNFEVWTSSSGMRILFLKVQEKKLGYETKKRVWATC
jgi:hypothetical protein